MTLKQDDDLFTQFFLNGTEGVVDINYFSSFKCRNTQSIVLGDVKIYESE